MNAQLSGIRILIPNIGDGGDLPKMIKSLGGAAVVVKVMDITPPRDPAAVARTLQNLNAAALIIFISKNAVRGAVEFLRQNNLTIPKTVRIAAIGETTAAACNDAQIKIDFCTREAANSEGLLSELEDYDVQGKLVLIFRAQDGRELLAQQLSARGAVVKHIEIYRRELAAPPPKELFAEPFNFILIRSATSVNALLKLAPLDKIASLKNTPLITYSERLLAYCRTHEMRAAGAVVATNNQAVVNELIAKCRN